MEFKEKLKSLLSQKHMTQRAFAAQVEMEYPYVNKFFTGRKPNLDFIDKVVGVFPEVDLNWLLRDDDGEPLPLVTEPAQNYGPEVLAYVRDIENALSKIKDKLAQE